ncbi:MAG: hypothetical protein AB7R69_05520 [Candidatus Babeliales bacterium]
MIAVLMLLFITTACASEKSLDTTYFQELEQKDISAQIALLAAANDIRARYTEKENYYLEQNSLYAKEDKSCVAEGPFYLFEPSVLKFRVGKDHLLLLKKELIYGTGAMQGFMVYDKKTKLELETIDPFDHPQPDIKYFLHVFAKIHAFNISPDMNNIFLVCAIPQSQTTLTESYSLIWLKKNSLKKWIEHLTKDIPKKDYIHLDFFEHLLPETSEPNHIAFLERAMEGKDGNITIHQLSTEKLPLVPFEEYILKKAKKE